MTTPPSSLDTLFSVESLGAIVDQLAVSHTDVFTGRVYFCKGADGITWRQFARHRDKHLRAISRKVLAGRYTFSPLLEFEKDKPGSKDKRIISVSTIRDTIVQVALYRHFYPLVDALLTDSVYGYRQGRSAHQAVRRIGKLIGDGQTSIFDADFQKFFDTVDHGIMLAKVGTLPGVDAKALVLFRRWLKSGRIETAEVQRHDQPGHANTRYVVKPRTIGLPQGGVLSGMASNLYLAEFDHAVRTVSCGYIRYADDFVACCRSETECENTRKVAETEAAKLKQALHPDKTKTCVSAEKGVDFLGFNIGTGWVRVRSKNISRFKKRITDIVASHRKRATVEKSLRALVHRLGYKIRGPKPEDVAKLLAAGHLAHPHRRSWVGFFRIVTDEEQIRQLDRWVRAQVSRVLWRHHRERVTYKDMKAAGLPSLIGHMYKARQRREAVATKGDGVAVVATPTSV